MNLKNISTLSMGLFRTASHLEGLQSWATMSNALKHPHNAISGSICSPLRYFQSWSSQHNSDLFKVLTTKNVIKAMGIIRWKSSIKSTGVHTKLKPYSAYKDRFKMTATGKIRYMRPGHVHKRFNKGSRQLRELGQTKLVQDVYARIMKRLGFKMRRF